MSAKKKTTKKAAKKSTAKKAVSKKTATKKAPQKAADKKAPAKKAASPKASAKKPTAKKAAKKGIKKAAPLIGSKKGSSKKEETLESKAKSDMARKILENREKHTPSVFKLPSRKNTPIVFSLDDVREVLKTRKQEEQDKQKDAEELAKKSAEKMPKKGVQPQAMEEEPVQKRKLGAASVADILGFATGPKPTRGGRDPSEVPSKFKRYYKLLIELRDHVREELDLHTKDTLKRSSKDDSGDLSSYSQHMADAGTDTFDRDFALSLVSTEQEALTEIEAAINRLFDGTYGVCEITGKPINKERLEVVPFTRYSLEGQQQHERTRMRKVQRAGAFADASMEDSSGFTSDDDDS